MTNEIFTQSEYDKIRAEIFELETAEDPDKKRLKELKDLLASKGLDMI